MTKVQCVIERRNPLFAVTHATRKGTDLLCAAHQVHDNWVASFRIWSRRSLFSGRAPTCRNQSNVWNSQRLLHVTLKFETKILRSDWFAQVILISVTPKIWGSRHQPLNHEKENLLWTPVRRCTWPAKRIWIPLRWKPWRHQRFLQPMVKCRRVKRPQFMSKSWIFLDNETPRGYAESFAMNMDTHMSGSSVKNHTSLKMLFEYSFYTENFVPIVVLGLSTTFSSSSTSTPTTLSGQEIDHSDHHPAIESSESATRTLLKHQKSCYMNQPKSQNQIKMRITNRYGEARIPTYQNGCKN